MTSSSDVSMDHMAFSFRSPSYPTTQRDVTEDLHAQ